jgi:hypothetical protein
LGEITGICHIQTSLKIIMGITQWRCYKQIKMKESEHIDSKNKAYVIFGNSNYAQQKKTMEKTFDYLARSQKDKIYRYTYGEQHGGSSVGKI